MTNLFRPLLAVLLLGVALPGHAGAQSASPAPASSLSTPSGGGATGPTPSMPAPSGGVATGKPAASAETPLERKEEQKMKKDTTICKGC